MTRDRIELDSCPRCGVAGLTCTWNFFDGKGVIIHSWEHKCLGCGLRETTAYRSDDDDGLPDDPRTCPYCGRQPNAD